MAIGRQALADLVRREMTKGDRDWSTHEVSRRAKRAGFTLSNGTVGNILNCRVQDFKEDTLRALAAAFGIPEAEVYAAYRGEAPGELSVDEQRAVNYVRSIREDKREDALMFLELYAQQYAERPPPAKATDRARPSRGVPKPRGQKKSAQPK